MDYDRKFLMWSLGYAVVGIALGIFMAASRNHSQFDTHAHVLLVGFVMSFAYAVICRLWLAGKPSRLAGAQFYLHQAGATIMFLGLFSLHGGIAAEEQISPFLGISSIAVFAAALLMMFMVIKARAH